MAKLLTFKQKQNEALLSKLEPKKNKNQLEKPVKFLVYSYANQCKAVTPLGPTLGQFNVNLIQFCELYNTNSKNYTDGLYLTATVLKKLKAKEFNFKLNPPTLRVLFECLIANYLNTDEYEKIEQNINNLPIELIFDLVLLYSYFHKFSILKSSKLVFSYLNTYLVLKNIKIN
jgi:ribosomal protein L11